MWNREALLYSKYSPETILYHRSNNMYTNKSSHGQKLCFQSKVKSIMSTYKWLKNYPRVMLLQSTHFSNWEWKSLIFAQKNFLLYSSPPHANIRKLSGGNAAKKINISTPRRERTFGHYFFFFISFSYLNVRDYI